MQDSPTEPENRTECPNTGEGHIWIWDSDKDDWYCDGRQVWHDDQGDFIDD